MKEVSTKARLDENRWIRCGECSHKLMRIMATAPEVYASPLLEIKCHSCKALNTWWYEGEVK